jgi:hypothetical protein
MKQTLLNKLHVILLTLVALVLGSPHIMAETKWDRCVNHMNSRGDKVPNSFHRHHMKDDLDDDEDEDDDDKGCGSNKCSNKKSCNKD